MPLLKLGENRQATSESMRPHWSVGEPAPAAASRIYRTWYSEAAGSSYVAKRSGRPLTAGRNIGMGVVSGQGDSWDAPSWELRDKAILLDITHADPQAPVLLRGGSADRDRSAAATSEARKR